MIARRTNGVRAFSVIRLSPVRFWKLPVCFLFCVGRVAADADVIRSFRCGRFDGQRSDAFALVAFTERLGQYSRFQRNVGGLRRHRPFSSMLAAAVEHIGSIGDPVRRTYRVPLPEMLAHVVSSTASSSRNELIGELASFGRFVVDHGQLLPLRRSPEWFRRACRLRFISYRSAASALLFCL